MSIDIEMDCVINNKITGVVEGTVFYDFEHVPDYCQGAMEDAERGSSEVKIWDASCRGYFYDEKGKEIVNIPIKNTKSLLSFVDEDKLIQDIIDHELT